MRLPKSFLFLLGVVFLLNLLQAHFTELIFDEAYYWHYAQEMAWGYFDHPPMVALMVRVGGWLFDGELGVRLMACILSVGTLTFLWLVIDRPMKKEYIPHFFVLVLSMPLLNAYGFLTLPDTPLLFFTALFLWVYKRYLKNPSTWNAVFMGLIMAALMYSKYHAVLVILFVLLSNLKLLADKRAWLAVGVALLCYVPHFVWLFGNDFVSINYHLFERPNAAYDFNKYTLAFFGNLAVMFGLTFPWMYAALYKSRMTDNFTKALIFLVYGVILFFFISSFNRRVQAQWLIVISIPMALLVFRQMLERPKLRRWIWWSGLANLLILGILRIGLFYKPLFPVYYETHGNKQWVQGIMQEVGDLPVVFENSYRNAPMYAFYSGVPTFSLNNIYYRRNQYSIDDSEKEMQHRNVLYISAYGSDPEYRFTKVDGAAYKGWVMEDFESFRKLRITLEDGPVTFEYDSPLEFTLINPYDEEIPLETLQFGLAYLDDFKKVQEVLPLPAVPIDSKKKVLQSNEPLKFTFHLPKTDLGTPGYFRIGVSENGLPYGLNGMPKALIR